MERAFQLAVLGKAATLVIMAAFSQSVQYLAEAINSHFRSHLAAVWVQILPTLSVCIPQPL